MSPPRVFLFAGPTLPPSALAAAAADAGLPDASALPPVSQGDVCRVARERPWGIGILDGYFGRVPAVWHKEILWAMTEGVHVFGAASMGALRAAELAAFGMEGVGEVFAAFRDGRLTDDDEVTVVHGSAAEDYRALSEAMVNFRFTLKAAVAAGVIGEAAHESLIGLAKATFYPHRGWPALLRQAAGRVPAAELDALKSWLPTGRVDQKREDARALLRQMAERRQADPGPRRVSFRFQHTDAWEAARRQAAERPLAGAVGVNGAATLPPDAALDELRLDGRRYLVEREAALARALALEVARLQGLAVSAEALAAAVEEFRESRGLIAEEDLDRFLNERGLTREGLSRWVRDELLERRVRALAGAQAGPGLRDRLKVNGEHAALASRAQAKQEALASRGLENPALADSSLRREEIWRWYFEERQGRPVPSDLPGYARSLDLPGEEALLRIVLRERCFVELV
ncbi:MAG TPA: TfuA-like protein [Thermoanaerobaculia bacterium]|nr:TfuA-like protein [Thermoanaerobaculia bacterium]